MVAYEMDSNVAASIQVVATVHIKPNNSLKDLVHSQIAPPATTKCVTCVLIDRNSLKSKMVGMMEHTGTSCEDVVCRTRGPKESGSVGC